MKKEDEELFAVFNFRREQVKAYVKLAEQEMTDDKIGAVFDILGKKAQKNVMYNMKRYFFSKKFNEAKTFEISIPVLFSEFQNGKSIPKYEAFS